MTSHKVALLSMKLCRRFRYSVPLDCHGPQRTEVPRRLWCACLLPVSCHHASYLELAASKRHLRALCVFAKASLNFTLQSSFVLQYHNQFSSIRQICPQRLLCQWQSLHPILRSKGFTAGYNYPCHCQRVLGLQL